MRQKLVPAEGIEPPTFGLQNRCSTAELSRRRWDAGRDRQEPGLSARARRNTRLGRKVPEPAMALADMNQAAWRPPDSWESTWISLLADVLATVVALDPGAGPANDAVSGRVSIPIAVPT